MSRLKVIHLISGGDVGGAKTHVLHLLKGLSGRIGVTLVCFRDGPFAEDARKLGIDTRIISGNGFRGDLRALNALIKRGEYDIVHSHGSRGNTMSALLKSRLGLPTLTTIHSDNKLDYLGSPLRGLTFGTLNRWALRRLDNMECVSEHLTEQFIKRGFKPSQMSTINNGLDFTTRPPVCDKVSTLAGWGLSCEATDVVIGCAARLDTIKDLGTLIRGVHKASQSCPNLKLIIAGDGDQRPVLEGLIKELQVADRVCLAGWIDRMDEFYTVIDVNTLTSTYEGFPYVLVEGARAELPTVATAVGGIPQLVVHGVTGLLFSPGDVQTLADHFSDLYHSEALRLQYGRRIRLRSQEKFSVEQTITTQLDIYTRIMQRRARPQNTRDGVLLCGAYGFGNAGDDGILAAILEELRQIDPLMPVIALSRKPRQTACQFRVDTQYTFNPLKLATAFKHTKLYLNGGGNLIQDATSSRSLWFYLYTLRLAKRCGAKTMMYACGVGPINRRFNGWLTARVLNQNVDAITMREDTTPQELNALGVSIPKSAVTADPALSLTPASEEIVDAAAHVLGLEEGKAYLCLAVRRWQGLENAVPAFASLISTAYEEYGLTSVVIPFEPQNDPEAAKLILQKVTVPYILSQSTFPPEVLIGLMARMRLVVGMRLHALIFAAGQGVPLIGVSYDTKATSFLRYLGQELCCTLSEATPERLTGMLRECMAVEDGTGVRLDAANRLRTLEQGNITMLKEML